MLHGSSTDVNPAQRMKVTLADGKKSGGAFFSPVCLTEQTAWYN